MGCVIYANIYMLILGMNDATRETKDLELIYREIRINWERLKDS